jgi:hypothetical protein
LWPPSIIYPHHNHTNQPQTTHKPHLTPYNSTQCLLLLPMPGKACSEVAKARRSLAYKGLSFKAVAPKVCTKASTEQMIDIPYDRRARGSPSKGGYTRECWSLRYNVQNSMLFNKGFICIQTYDC